MKKKMTGFMIKFAAACAAVCLSVSALAAGAPTWRWRVDTWPASGTNTVALLASTGGQIEWVRWNAVAGPTNEAAATVTLVSAADGYATAIASLTVSNEAATAVSAASSMVNVTNAQWRAGDSITTAATGITNGTFAAGYWYYE